jgi:hypothetical protein
MAAAATIGLARTTRSPRRRGMRYRSRSNMRLNLTTRDRSFRSGC